MTTPDEGWDTSGIGFCSIEDFQKWERRRKRKNRKLNKELGQANWDDKPVIRSFDDIDRMLWDKDQIAQAEADNAAIMAEWYVPERFKDVEPIDVTFEQLLAVMKSPAPPAPPEVITHEYLASVADDPELLRRANMAYFRQLQDQPITKLDEYREQKRYRFTTAADRYVDWETIWDRPVNKEFIVEPILAKGRGTSIYATHGVGKSLLSLWMSTKAIQAGHVVLYLDYEMSEDDLVDRLGDMGYGKGDDLSRFKYAISPQIPDLNTEDGGLELAAWVDELIAAFPDRHLVVIIDTIGRAVKGEENSNDTIRDFYKYTGSELKRRALTWLRLDHAGKDTGRGARGGSAKGDDVDVVWGLSDTPAEKGSYDVSKTRFTLSRVKARMGWIKGDVDLLLRSDPLRFEVAVVEETPAAPALDRVAALAKRMDDLGLPLNVSKRAAKRAGIGGRDATILAAIRHRQADEQGEES